MTRIPSTVSHIGYHAATMPTKVAIVDGGRAITYQDLVRDIGKMAAALQDLGLGEGQTAAVEITGFYRHWVMLLACEALGAATMSYSQSEATVLAGYLASMDRVICAPGAEPEAARAIHVADDTWLNTVSLREPLALPPSLSIPPDAPMRIIKSYGTTGVLDLMIHTARIHDFWLRQFRFRATMDRNARYLLTAGFGIQAFHVHATSCLRMGGTVVCGNPNEFAIDIERHRITHATFMPAQLEQLLKGQGALPMEPRLKQIFTIGAPVTKGVRDRTRQILAEEVSESYGTNEAGGIASMDDNGIGTVFPGVEVEVLDDAGKPVIGSPGQVRLRSAGVVDAYWGDGGLSPRMFRDGWFHPGDIAVLHDRTRLTLIGREEDYLTLDGKKYTLDVLERRMRDALPARDLCLLLPRNEKDAALTLLIQTDSPADADHIRREAKAHLPKGLNRLTVVEAHNIPRGTDGRVQRAKLSWQLHQALTGQNIP